MARSMGENAKEKSLWLAGALNPHPEEVQVPLFLANEFFDPRDFLQVKYEMIRRVRVDGDTVAGSARLFGLSRPAFYKADAAFEKGGLSALVRQRPGPKSAHKLTPEVMKFILMAHEDGEPLGARALAKRVMEELGVMIHPRTIERGFQSAKKKRS